jgi:O-antigen/teichoic acid export membrane protein
MILSFIRRGQHLIGEDYRVLLRSTVVYGISIAVSRSIGFLITPFLTRIFLPAQYGVLDTVVATVALLPGFMSLGLENALIRYFHDFRDEDERAIFTSTVFSTVAVVSLVVSIAAMLAIPYVQREPFAGAEYSTAMALAIVGGALQLVAYMFLWLLRLQQRMWEFLVCTLSGVIVNLFLIWALIGVFRQGIAGYFWALLISSLIQGSLSFVLTRHQFRWRFSAHWLKQALLFSAPFIPTVFIASFMAFLARYFLVEFANLTQVGYYGVASKIAGMVMVVFLPLQMAWQPFSMSIMRRPNAKLIYANSTRYTMAALSAAVFAMVALAPAITRLIAGPAYQPADDAVRFLVLALALGQLMQFFQISIFIHEKPVLILYAFLLALGAFAVGAYILAPTRGATGVAVATVVASIVQVGSVYWFAQRQSRVQYPVRRICFLFLAAFFACAYVSAIGHLSTPGLGIAMSMGCAASVGLAFGEEISRFLHLRKQR